jgi:hypothetical protein
VNVPPVLALIHLQNQTGISGPMIERCVEKQEIRPKLSDWNGPAINQRLDLTMNPKGDAASFN